MWHKAVKMSEPLTKQSLERMLATAFQDGYGCALRHKNYKNRTQEHTELLWQQIQEFKAPALPAKPKPPTNCPADDKCPTCGASTQVYWYKITPGLIDILLILLYFVHSQNRNSFNQKDVRDQLKPFQYTQFTKLRFHGLINHRLFKNFEKERSMQPC